jgi:hypothetical protein
LHHCEAADAPAERFAAKFFPCGKFDFARLLVRVRKSRRDQSRACACNAIVLSDVSETRIPRALFHCLEFLEQICASAKKFSTAYVDAKCDADEVAWREPESIHKIKWNAVFFSVLV